MKRISPERKSAVLARILRSYNMTVSAVAQAEEISEATLYNWPSQAKSEGKLELGADKKTGEWPSSGFKRLTEARKFTRWYNDSHPRSSTDGMISCRWYSVMQYK
ncbi:transposase [Morganella morganii]|uniref:transposase n=1 Tax=Morganella morganii TaxID=582 RepID=UPI000469655D|nr:transposase [Morganella morganii]